MNNLERVRAHLAEETDEVGVLFAFDEVAPLVSEIECLRDLLAEFVTDADDDPCRFDHHGYCQTHGWFESNQPCRMARARAALEA